MPGPQGLWGASTSPRPGIHAEDASIHPLGLRLPLPGSDLSPHPPPHGGNRTWGPIPRGTPAPCLADPLHAVL